MTKQVKLAVAIGLILAGAGAMTWGVFRAMPSRDSGVEQLASDAVKLEVEQREHQRLVDMPAVEFDALYKDTAATLAQLKKANAPPEELAVIQADMDKLEKAKADRAKKR